MWSLIALLFRIVVQLWLLVCSGMKNMAKANRKCLGDFVGRLAFLDLLIQTDEENKHRYKAKQSVASNGALTNWLPLFSVLSPVFYPGAYFLSFAGSLICLDKPLCRAEVVWDVLGSNIYCLFALHLVVFLLRFGFLLGMVVYPVKWGNLGHNPTDQPSLASLWPWIVSDKRMNAA